MRKSKPNLKYLYESMQKFLDEILNFIDKNMKLLKVTQKTKNQRKSN